MFLESELVALRAMEPSDLKLLYQWENHPELWTISELPTPLSYYTLEAFVKTAYDDIYTTRQLRFMVMEQKTKKTVGIIDLFNFDPLHQRAGVGIIIAPMARNNRIASEALELLKRYCFQSLFMHQLFCHIETSNVISQRLFQNANFELVGIKKEWKKTSKGFVDVLFYQCINR